MDKKRADNRMGWILLMEECSKSKKKKFYHTEYEICSDARIPGVLEYNDGAILCGLLEEKNEKGLYTYSLRVKHVEKEYKFDKTKYSKEGYFFKEGLIGELLAIFSVFFQARFYLKTSSLGTLSAKSLKFRNRHEFNHRRINKFLNFEMFTGQKRNWAHETSGLKSFLETIKSIDQNYHQNLIHSFFWYADAIKEFGINDEIFFIKMTSCIEPLLKFNQSYKDNLEEKIEEWISKEALENSHKQEIANWLQNRKIGKRFSDFISKHSKGFFKGGKRKAKHCYIYKKDLNEFTKRIYNARSKYLHEGRPMYLSMEMKSDSGKYWDLDPSLGMMADRKEFKVNERLPRCRWFERIVNHSLKSFVQEVKLTSK